MSLQSDTQCYVALLKPNGLRPAPDLIVSVLDPSKYGRMIRIRTLQPDRLGVIAGVLECVPKGLNIALAETATVEALEPDTDDKHEVTLICEAPDDGFDGLMPLPTEAEVRARFEERGLVPDTKVDTYPSFRVGWQTTATVKAGWIRKLPWRVEAEALCDTTSPHLGSIDFSQVVVSADTTRRLMRFVFPYRGACTIRIEHRDTPGTLRHITDVLLDHQVNILSMYLKRGGVLSGKAVAVVVCEPSDGLADRVPYEEIKRDLKAKLPPNLMIQSSLNSAVDSARVINPVDAGVVLAPVPVDLLDKVAAVRKEHRGKFMVFFSHRFGLPQPAGAYAQAIRDALAEEGCALLESNDRDFAGGRRIVYSEVSKYMWAADAGIIMLCGTPEGTDPLGRNVPHEFGFLQGQAKPAALFIESGHEEMLREWSNIDGVFATRFPSGAVALDKTHPESINAVVRSFVDYARSRRGRRPMA
jgi:hypothetical protein